ncbi:hypothetical protein F3Y22_tig00113548pilonHSYRG00113 [Hibiscus syriacus]|uniref:Uncharacterized protein n=1 Tax=Hibiscus syriacus TaxID=106335 RepID=A0A6A2XZJ5_HIBSY|nr:uncharacterized protein LOC120186479 [Hibiscus syriacus]KAE8662327.1 hypothetical protein F3Y22_tig00113548pilonHSYRG00113 [Hibiscus syriacus]
MAQKSTTEPISTSRISFSSDFFLDESNVISINPHSRPEEELKKKGGGSGGAGELFCRVLRRCREERDGKTGFRGKEVNEEEGGKAVKKEERRASWFVVGDDELSPRPPRCTVLWKELLRLKKQGASSMLPSSSSRSSVKTRKWLFEHK